MTVASFAISALAFVVSGASLGWNVLNYLLTGQRASLSASGMRLLTTMGTEMEPVLQITVMATGRVPVEVTSWSVMFPNDLHLHSTLVHMQYDRFKEIHFGDDLPKMIQPGSRASFNIPKVAIEKGGEHQKLDLNEGYINVYFAARKPLRDKKAIAQRFNRTAACLEDTGTNERY